jgi:hypothetical protein
MRLPNLTGIAAHTRITQRNAVFKRTSTSCSTSALVRPARSPAPALRPFLSATSSLRFSPIPSHRHQFLKQRSMATHAASSAQPTDYGHFKLLQSFDIKYAPVKVSKWRSERTGLTVVVGDHASPVVNSGIREGDCHELISDQRTFHHRFRE